MKTIYFFFTILFVSTFGAQQASYIGASKQDIEGNKSKISKQASAKLNLDYRVKSKITEVTLFLDGAEVTRKANVNLKSGTTEFTFNKLSSEIEESSIQISGLKDASVLSIKYGINYLSKQKQTDTISALKAELKQINNKVQKQYHLISGYNEEIDLIQSNKRLSNETKVVSLEQLKAFASYYRTRITALKTAINVSHNKIEKFEQSLTDINKQLAELNTDEKVQTGEIKLKLNTGNPDNLDLKITYNVKNAGWFPIYDLKAEQINQPIRLSYKAHVFQNTGCDWNDVNIVLSTADPNTNNEKPIVNPKYLNFISNYSSYKSQRATKSYNYKYNPLVKTVSGVVTTASDGLPLPGVTVMEKGTINGVQTNSDGRYTISIENGKDLVYSYIGMQTETLPVHSSVINVALDLDTEALQEVVIVGYGSSKSASAVVKTIKSEDIINKLYGMASGIRIRGASSLDGNQTPLYVIDGVPVKESAASNIDPNSIIDIEVLKDASATAIYGNRATNGVIIIKTSNTNQRQPNALGVTVDSGITNTRFEIDKTYSIPSDGDINVIKIDTFNIPAEYDYFSAPLLNENVFLTAKITNWEQYNLLPAEANVYFEGSYSGKTNINPNTTAESLTISLGVDPNITVKRTQNNNFKKTTLVGSNKVVYKGFEIELRNNKAIAIKLTLLDRIPISQNKSIKVDDINFGDANYDKDKGVLKWLITLKSGETKKAEHSYTLKYPKFKRVNL